MKRTIGLADAYARYADLIAAQLAAIENDEFDEFTSLTHEREALARSIDSMHAVDPDGSAEIARAAMSHLEAALAADVMLRERIDRIQNDSLDGARAIGRNRKAIRSYAAPAETGARVDLSL